MTLWDKKTYKDNEERLTNTEQQWVSDGGKARQVSLDSLTLVPNVIDYEHHEIHSGSTFRVQHNSNAVPATGTGGELVIAFFVPDQKKEPHMIWEFVHEGDMTMKVLEGVTLTLSNGTDVSCKNSNRNSSKTSILQGTGTGALVSGYVTVGLNTDSIYTGGSTISLKRNFAAKNQPGEGGRRAEIILKTNTYYAFVLDNNETTAQGAQIRLEWYEHSPKE